MRQSEDKYARDGSATWREKGDAHVHAVLVILSMKRLNARGMQCKICVDLSTIKKKARARGRANAATTHESLICPAPCIPVLTTSDKRRRKRPISRRKRIVAMKRDRALLLALNERGRKSTDSVALEHGRCQLMMVH